MPLLGTALVNLKVREALSEFRQGLVELSGSASTRVEILVSKLLELAFQELLEAPGSIPSFSSSETTHQDCKNIIMIYSMCMAAHLI